MRVKSIRLAWFRGAADPVALEPDGKSIVVYGENGAGKSSFVDAVEHVMNDGRIGHLAHEYSGKHYHKGILNSHTPGDRKTEFWIAFTNGEELHVQIKPNGVHSCTGAGSVNMRSWDYRCTALRQDEVAHFIGSQKAQKYSALLPLLGLQGLEFAAENVRQLGKAVEQQSKVKELRGYLLQTAAKRREVFGDDTDEEIERTLAELHSKRCPESSETSDPLARCSEIKSALAEQASHLSGEQLCYHTLRSIVDIDLRAAIKAIRDIESKLVGSLEPLIQEKVEVLQCAYTYATKLQTEHEIACPACGRPIPVELFQAHVKREQERLEEIIRIFDERKAAIVVLLEDVKTIKNCIAKPELKRWAAKLRSGPLRPNLEWLEQFNAERVRQTFEASVLTTVEEMVLPLAAEAQEASKNAPPDVPELSRDETLVNAAKPVIEARSTAVTVANAEALIAFLGDLETEIRAEIRERSQAVITDISADIGRMWGILHPGEPIEDVRLYLPDDEKAIDVALKYHGKEQDSPRLTLSEGYRNSLGLCIFLAMTKRGAGSERPLFLDDVVVSLDRNHRGMIVDILEKEFPDRQVILFTHDRDWYAELRQQLDQRRWSFKALLPYEGPLTGIRWSHKTSTFGDARAHLKERPDSAGNDARKIMDVELAIAAERLQIRLPYLRGDRNDKRTSHEFLERLIFDGRKCFQKKTGADHTSYTEALDLFVEAQRLLVSWGNRSSHTFNVVRSEAIKLIDTCEKALASLKCSGCDKYVWFADAEKSRWVQCGCGDLRWRYDRT